MTGTATGLFYPTLRDSGWRGSINESSIRTAEKSFSRDPVSASGHQLDRIVRSPEQLLRRRSPGPALLIAQNHGLDERENTYH